MWLASGVMSQYAAQGSQQQYYRVFIAKCSWLSQPELHSTAPATIPQQQQHMRPQSHQQGLVSFGGTTKVGAQHAIEDITLDDAVSFCRAEDSPSEQTAHATSMLSQPRLDPGTFGLGCLVAAGDIL